MPAFHEGQARAAIKTVLDGVANMGKVHDYERFADDWEALQTMYQADIAGVSQLRGWSISLEDMSQEQLTFGPPGTAGTDEVSYGYRIRGYMAVSDEDASEKTFVTLALTAKQALDDAAALHSSRLDQGAAGEFYGPPCPAARWDFRTFGDVLVHYAEIEILVKEVV